MKCNSDIKNRIKRVQGQINGIIKMMDEEKTCEDILMQLKAIRTAVDRAISLIATNNLIQTIEDKNGIEVKDVEDQINLIIKNS